MNVLFVGTPDFAVAPLEALHKAHTIVGVFTQPDAKVGRGKKLTPPIVKQRALALGLNVHQPTELTGQHDLIVSLVPDVIVVVAYGMLLPQSVLDIPRLGCLNIHASILPRWRGAAPIHRAIEAGDAQSGVSIMRMESGLDTGPVYDTLITNILASDTTPSLHDRLAQLGAKGICNTLAQLDTQANLEPTPQDQLNNGLQTTYAKKILKNESEIDWSQSAQQIEQRIRAFLPWPVCQSHHTIEHTHTRIRISQSSISTLANVNKARPGDIIEINESGIHVQCGDGVLNLERLQRDGSKVLMFNEFLNGYPLNVGQRLSSPQ